MNIVDELFDTQGHLFRASAKLQKLWLYLPESHKNKVGRFRGGLDRLLVELEQMRRDPELGGPYLFSPEPDPPAEDVPEVKEAV
jgi:hypothetical protein